MSDDTADEQQDQQDEMLLGLAVLLTVPLVWGSYVPVVKVLYQIDPPIPGLVFSTAYFAVASAAASFLLFVQQQQQEQQQQQQQQPGDIGIQQSTPDDDEPPTKEKGKADNNNSSIHIKAGRTTPAAPAVLFAGAELGFYLFLGNTLQVIGLETVPSDRAGFLVQSK
jgi:hypothetical protein